jgi:ribose 5-phosphate isomerase B
MSRTLFIASDHGALDLKEDLIAHISARYPELTVTDLGTNTTDSVDYPDFGQKVATHVLKTENSLGICLCGTGIGISISANRFKGIRAALVYDEFTAEMAKAHNNANVLCLGGRTTPSDTAKTLVDTWLTTEYEGGRHQRRLDKLDI